MMLQHKVAVIYGAGGAIGGAVARAFAREGATLFLTGRTLAPVEAVGQELVSAGGSADVAEVDALDEQAVDKHLQSVTDKAGHIDISFNAIGIPNPTIRPPLTELDVEQFARDLSQERFAPRVREHFMGGVRSGVNGTPTFFINGVRHDGGFDYQSLLEAINEQL